MASQFPRDFSAGINQGAMLVAQKGAGVFFSSDITNYCVIGVPLTSNGFSRMRPAMILPRNSNRSGVNGVLWKESDDWLSWNSGKFAVSASLYPNHFFFFFGSHTMNLGLALTIAACVRIPAPALPLIPPLNLAAGSGTLLIRGVDCNGGDVRHD